MSQKKPKPGRLKLPKGEDQGQDRARPLTRCRVAAQESRPKAIKAKT